MVCHVLKTTLPLGYIKVFIAEPRISVTGRAAPCTFGHVVIEVDIDSLLRKLGGDGIKDLRSAMSARLVTIVGSDGLPAPWW